MGRDARLSRYYTFSFVGSLWALGACAALVRWVRFKAQKYPRGVVGFVMGVAAGWRRCWLGAFSKTKKVKLRVPGWLL